MRHTPSGLLPPLSSIQLLVTVVISFQVLESAPEKLGESV